jgi:hypothetical protein
VTLDDEFTNENIITNHDENINTKYRQKKRVMFNADKSYKFFNKDQKKIVGRTKESSEVRLPKIQIIKKNTNNEKKNRINKNHKNADISEKMLQEPIILRKKSIVEKSTFPISDIKEAKLKIRIYLLKEKKQNSSVKHLLLLRKN